MWRKTIGKGFVNLANSLVTVFFLGLLINLATEEVTDTAVVGRAITIAFIAAIMLYIGGAIYLKNQTN